MRPNRAEIPQNQSKKRSGTLLTAGPVGSSRSEVISSGGPSLARAVGEDPDSSAAPSSCGCSSFSDDAEPSAWGCSSFAAGFAGGATAATDGAAGAPAPTPRAVWTTTYHHPAPRGPAGRTTRTALPAPFGPTIP